MTGKNWKSLTKKQLKKWVVLHDELLFGKLAGNLNIYDGAEIPSILGTLAGQIKINILCLEGVHSDI